MKVIVLEHHPNDSRIKIADDGICQALTSRMGTGGGNVPLVIVIDDDGKREEDDRCQN
jgi:DNA (cytosine-5)-methyltransferase 1